MWENYVVILAIKYETNNSKSCMLLRYMNKNYKNNICKKKSENYFLADYKILRTWFNIRSTHSDTTDVFMRVGDSNVICNYKMHKRVLLLYGSRDVLSYLMTIIFCMWNFVLWGPFMNWYIQPSEYLFQSQHKGPSWVKKIKLKVLSPKNRIWQLLHLKLQIQFDLQEFLCEL